ncbi:MAG: mechanosensitive ion channel family protein [Kangiellaceae bacterium]|nr:mechanosensitive ion channel family protein [Kangiellaceae bacterium]
MAEQTTATEQAENTDSQVAEQMFSDIKSWLPDFILNYWEQLQTHPWILMLVVLATGYIIAKVSQWLFKTVWGSLTAKTENDFDDRIIAVLSKPVFSVIFYGAMALAVEALQLSSSTDTTLKRVIFSLLIIALIVTAWKGSKVILEALSHNRKYFKFVEERTIPVLNIMTQILVIGLGSYFLILLWGKDPTAWLASAGVIGIAIGFAAKDTLANLFAGFFIVADAPYKLGDYIVLDTGERGMVTHVGIRSTRLLTRDDVEVTIPNSVMGNAKIVNESGGPWVKTRIRVAVGVSYDSDLDKVCAVLEDIANQSEHVCKDPVPRVRAKLFNGSSIDFQIQAWIDRPELRGRVIHNLILTIHQRFKDEGIEIPYSKQDLYIKELPKNDD